MHFHDDALFPEVQEKLVITARRTAPSGSRTTSARTCR